MDDRSKARALAALPEARLCVAIEPKGVRTPLKYLKLIPSADLKPRCVIFAGEHNQTVLEISCLLKEMMKEESEFGCTVLC